MESQKGKQKSKRKKSEKNQAEETTMKLIKYCSKCKWTLR